jgi:predicted nucleic acid-binding protein
MSAETAFVDTNVLVYSLYEDSDQHKAALALLERVQDGELNLAITSQILGEVYAVITDPRRVSGEIFDVQHVAIMLCHGLKKIYTFNRADFEPFTDIEVLVP